MNAANSADFSNMATAEQVKSLLKSYSEGEGGHFVSVALQIAADAARSGKEKLVHELRDLVDDIKHKQAAGQVGQVGQVGRAVPIARPQGELPTCQPPYTRQRRCTWEQDHD